MRRHAAHTLPLAVARDRERFKTLLTGTGTRVALGRKVDDYLLSEELGSGLWWQIVLSWDNLAGEQNHSLWGSTIGAPMVSLDDGDASWAYTGTGWTSNTFTGATGGTLHRNATLGVTSTWTTPAAVTSVGRRIGTALNGGYAKVTIDGSATAATFLPTAQAEVTAGRLVSTALVANGGTLNPTDRLLSYYSASQTANVPVLLATGLASAVHTVVMVNTGYKPSASTDIRMYDDGGLYGTATTTPATSGAVIASAVTLLYNSSVYEYAITYTPTGGSQTPFIGNRHGNEVEDSLTFTVDGVTTTLTDGQTVIGSTIVATRTTHLTHPDAIGNVGTGTCTYTLTPTGGLAVDWTINWLQAGLARSSYAGMLPTQNNQCDKGRAAGGPVVTMLADDNSNLGGTRSDTLLLWDSLGHAAVMMTCRNLPTAVNGWKGATTDFAWFQDRTGGDFNKGYLQRVQAGSSEAIAPGDTWQSRLTYRTGWLTDPSVLAA